LPPLSRATTANVSFPIGASTLTVQLRPCVFVVHPGEVGVRVATTGVPLLTEIESAVVEGET